MVTAKVLLVGVAYVVPFWVTDRHRTRSSLVVLYDEGHPVYFVVEINRVHIISSIH